MTRSPISSTALLALALAACGGSASESPWPVEPVETDSTPEGEALPGGSVDTRKLPDRYTKKQAAEEEAAPEEEEPLEEEELPEEEEAPER